MEPVEKEPKPDMARELGLELVTPITDDEKAELDFLRYESAHLQRRLRSIEVELDTAVVERDTIRHERNLMAQDFEWTLHRLATSPAGPLFRRLPGFSRMLDTWGTSAQ